MVYIPQELSAVPTEDDKDREELHIRNTLKSCGYPKWIFDKVKHDQCQKRKKTIDTNNRNKSAQESKGLAVIPYVEGLSETAERIFCKYVIYTAMKPYRTLRQLDWILTVLSGWRLISKSKKEITPLVSSS